MKTLPFFEAKREVFGLAKHPVHACKMYEYDQGCVRIQIRIILGSPGSGSELKLDMDPDPHQSANSGAAKVLKWSSGGPSQIRIALTSLIRKRIQVNEGSGSELK